MKEHMYSRPRLLDKGRARYRRERRRDPLYHHCAMTPARSRSTDAIRVILPTLDGKVIYTAAPVGGWRFELDTMVARMVNRVVAAGEPRPIGRSTRWTPFSA